MTKDETLKMALDFLMTRRMSAEAVIEALNKALAQPPLPVQEPAACRFCFSEKGCWTWQCYHCGEIDDVQQPAPPQQQAETVAMRMPKVGDKVICIEDESLGEVVSLTAGGSPDITFNDGSRGTYLLREFAELFGYVASPLPVQEPVAWDKPSASFDEWWDGDRCRDTANPFQTDSFSYWAFEGWQAALAQRPWAGLTEQERNDLEDALGLFIGKPAFDAIEASLKERNT